MLCVRVTFFFQEKGGNLHFFEFFFDSNLPLMNSCDRDAGDDECVLDEDLEIQAIIRTNQLLRRSETLARTALCTAQVQLKAYQENEIPVTAKHILTCILRELCMHYETEITQTSNSILGSYYVIDPKNQYHILPDRVETFIENLWYGRTNQFVIDFMGSSCNVTLHPSELKDGLPMVTISVNGTKMCIAKRNFHSTHIHMYKFQPIVAGMGLKSEVATNYSKHMSSNSDSTSLWPNNDELESVAAVWLRRAKSIPAKSTLHVNTAAIRNFISFISVQDSRCHFVLSGQKSLFAYIQVTCNTNDVFLLPVGTVAI
jgi:hypothetical protein